MPTLCCCSATRPGWAHCKGRPRDGGMRTLIANSNPCCASKSQITIHVGFYARLPTTLTRICYGIHSARPFGSTLLSNIFREARKEISQQHRAWKLTFARLIPHCKCPCLYYYYQFISITILSSNKLEPKTFLTTGSPGVDSCIGVLTCVSEWATFRVHYVSSNVSLFDGFGHCTTTRGMVVRKLWYLQVPVESCKEKVKNTCAPSTAV